MKKLFTLIALVLTFIISAQQEVKKDTLKKQVIVTETIICSNYDKDKWFTITPTFEKSNGVVVKIYLATLKQDIGSKSNKPDQLVFKFTSGKIIKILSDKSRKDEYGYGITYFPVNAIDAAFLKTKKIESIRYINGDDASYLYTTKKETSYFINIFSKF